MKRAWNSAEAAAPRVSSLLQGASQSASRASIHARAAVPQCRQLHASSKTEQGNSRDTIELSDDPLSNSVATSWKGVKRFYTHVSVRNVQGVKDAKDVAQSGWQVLVQGRPLRTHAVNELLLPTQGLALAIAGEFAAQGDVIRPASTPLYNLACLAVDAFGMEDLALAEDLEAVHRATRLSTWDRIEARAIVQEEQQQAGAGTKKLAPVAPSPAPAVSAGSSDKGTITSTTMSAVLAQGGTLAAMGAGMGMQPLHAKTGLTGRSDSGALSSSGSSGTAKLRDLLLDYLETDTVCYRVDWDMADPGERLLRKRQDGHYNPLTDWFEGAYGVKLGLTVGIGDVEHPEEAYAVVEDAADSADPWLKAALQVCTGVLKSSVVSLALVNRAVDVEGAFEASRVEEEWQIGENGFVEDGHDTSRGYVKTQLAAVSTFLWLLPSSAPRALPAPGRKGYEAALARSREERAARVQARRAREASLVSRKREVMKAMVLEEERTAAAARMTQLKKETE